MTKVDWLAAGASLGVSGLLLVRFPCHWRTRYRPQNLLANGKQGPVPEERCQTLLTNKKQGKMRPRDATNIINPY